MLYELMRISFESKDLFLEKRCPCLEMVLYLFVLEEKQWAFINPLSVNLCFDKNLRDWSDFPRLREDTVRDDHLIGFVAQTI